LKWAEKRSQYTGLAAREKSRQATSTYPVEKRQNVLHIARHLLLGSCPNPEHWNVGTLIMRH
jgi:hypothetical protein